MSSRIQIGKQSAISCRSTSVLPHVSSPLSNEVVSIDYNNNSSQLDSDDDKLDINNDLHHRLSSSFITDVMDEIFHGLGDNADLTEFYDVSKSNKPGIAANKNKNNSNHNDVDEFPDINIVPPNIKVNSSNNVNIVPRITIDCSSNSNTFSNSYSYSSSSVNSTTSIVTSSSPLTTEKSSPNPISIVTTSSKARVLDDSDNQTEIGDISKALTNNSLIEKRHNSKNKKSSKSNSPVNGNIPLVGLTCNKSKIADIHKKPELNDNSNNSNNCDNSDIISTTSIDNKNKKNHHNRSNSNLVLSNTNNPDLKNKAFADNKNNNTFESDRPRSWYGGMGIIETNNHKLSETLQKILPSWFLPPFQIRNRTMLILMGIDEIYLSELKFWEEVNKGLLFFIKPRIHEENSRAAFEGIAEMYVMSSGIVSSVTNAMDNLTDVNIDSKVTDLLTYTVNVLKTVYKKYCSKLCKSLWTSLTLLVESKKFREFVTQAQIQSSLILYQLSFMPFERLAEWKSILNKFCKIDGFESIAIKLREIEKLNKDMIAGQNNAIKLMQMLIQVGKCPIDILTTPGQVLRLSEPVDNLMINKKGVITSRKLTRLYLLRNELVIVKIVNDNSATNNNFEKFDLRSFYNTQIKDLPKKIYKVEYLISLRHLQLYKVDYTDNERGQSIMEIQEIQSGKIKTSLLVSCLCEKYRNQWIDYCNSLSKNF